jgi:HEAT repeat protein
MSGEAFPLLREAAREWLQHKISDEDLLRAAPPWAPPKEEQLSLVRFIGEHKLSPLENLLSQALRHKNAEVRRAAVSAVVSCGCRSLSVSLPLLFTDRVKDVRQAALWGASSLRDPRVIPQVAQCLQSEDEDLRCAALSALGGLCTPETSKPIVDALKDSSAKVRAQAVYAFASANLQEKAHLLVPLLRSEETRDRAKEALRHLYHVDVLPMLERMLSTQDKLLQRAVVEILAEWRSGDPTLLVSLLTSEDSEVATTAARALYWQKAVSVSAQIAQIIERDPLLWAQRDGKYLIGWVGGDPLIALASRLLQHESPVVRCLAVNAMYFGRFPGFPENVAQLLDDQDVTVRHEVVSVLVHGLPSSLAPRMLSIASDTKEPSRTRASALRALGYLRDSTHGDFIASFLDDPDSEIRMHSAFALRDLGPLPYLDVILAHLQDSSSKCRWALLAALQDTYQLEELPRVVASLSDADEQVQSQAIEIIGSWRATHLTETLASQLSSTDPQSEVLEALARVGATQYGSLIASMLEKNTFFMSNPIDLAGDLALIEAVPALRRLGWMGKGDALIALGKIGVKHQHLRESIQRQLSEIFQYRRLYQPEGRSALVGLAWLGAAEREPLVSLLKWMQDPRNEHSGYVLRRAICEGLFQAQHKALVDCLEERIAPVTLNSFEELRALFVTYKINLRLPPDIKWTTRRSAAAFTCLRWLLEDLCYPDVPFVEQGELLLLTEEEALERWEKRLS